MAVDDETDGDRVVREWDEAGNTEGRRALARRIDAALAEAQESVKLAWQAGEKAIADQERHHARALTEREAQIARLTTAYENSQTANLQKDAWIAALHGQLRVGVEFVKNGAPSEHFMEWARNADHLCADIIPAARAFVERIRDETREECAKEVDACVEDWNYKGSATAENVRVAMFNLAAAIRALPPRRGT